MKFEWDVNKSKATLESRGLTFEQAVDLWLDQDAIELTALVSDELRMLKVGKLIDGKIYTAVFTMRGENIRIISFRRARTNEEKAYAKG